MRKYLLLIILCCSTLTLFSQRGSHLLSFEYFPLTVIDPYHPRHRISIDYWLDKYGFAAQIGYGDKYRSLSDGHPLFSPNYRYLEFRPELRYSIINNIEESFIFKMYLSCEGFYQICKDNKPIYPSVVFDGEVIRGHPNHLYYERIKYGVNFKYGIQIICCKFLSFGTFVGIGYKAKLIDKYSINQATREKLIDYYFVDYNPITIISGDYQDYGFNDGLNVTIGIKIGIAFNLK